MTRRRFWIVGHGHDRAAYRSMEAALAYIGSVAWQAERLTLTSRVLPVRPNGTAYLT